MRHTADERSVLDREERTIPFDKIREAALAIRVFEFTQAARLDQAWRAAKVGLITRPEIIKDSHRESHQAVAI